MTHEHAKLFHPGRAHLLDDAERREVLPPELIADALDVRAGQIIADIGAGTGYFARAFAPRVAPGGRIYAVDMQPEMLDLLRSKLDGDTSLLILPVLARAEETTLPSDGADLVFFGSVWHEFDEPAMVLLEARRIMRLGGRIAIVDWRADAPPPPGPPAWHRQALGDLVKTLRRERWQVRLTRHLGPYTYLVTADLS
jgi:ubiquinone/menaquinone biosynthesis C-methylase UbiE